MSDTPNDPVREIPEDLLPGIHDDKISRKKARDVIYSRIREGGHMSETSGWIAAEKVAHFIADNDDGLMYESTIRRLDLRSVIQRIQAEEEMNPLVTRAVQEAFDAETQVQRTSLEATLDTTNMSRGEIEAEVARLLDEDVEPGTIRMSPTAQQTNILGGGADRDLAGKSRDEMTAAERFRADTAQIFFQPNVDERPFEFLSPADVTAIFRLATSDLGQARDYLDYMGAINAAREEGRLPDSQRTGAPAIGRGVTVPDEERVIWEEGLEPEEMDWQFVGHPTSTLHQIELDREMANRQARARGERSYTYTEALNLLWTMDAEELASVQDMLMAAGYYETGDGRRTEGPLFRGDPTDELTQQAWRNLLNDSVRTREAMVPLLERRTEALLEARALQEEQEEEDRLEEARKRRREEMMISLSDPVGLQRDADELATRTIGRNLGEAEQQRIVEFIHSLERERGETMIERADGNEVMSIDIQAQIENQIREGAPIEAGGKDVQSQYDAFTRMLAGPGGSR